MQGRRSELAGRRAPVLCCVGLSVCLVVPGSALQSGAATAAGAGWLAGWRANTALPHDVLLSHPDPPARKQTGPWEHAISMAFGGFVGYQISSWTHNEQIRLRRDLQELKKTDTYVDRLQNPKNA